MVVDTVTVGCAVAPDVVGRVGILVGGMGEVVILLGGGSKLGGNDTGVGDLV
jgi:hypothetical protein